MAKTLTIERFDGSNWEELYPKTTIEQVVNLSTTLADKQTKLTLNDGKDTAIGGTVDVSPTSTSKNLVSSGGVFSAISNVMEVAEGKTSSFVTTAVPAIGTDNFYFPCGTQNIQEGSQYTISELREMFGEVTVTSSSPSLGFEGFGSTTAYLYKTVHTSGDNWEIEKSIPLSSLKVGDVILLTNTDLPDFWVAEPTTGSYGLQMSKLETTKVPISEYSLKSDTIKDVKYESNKLQKQVNGSNSYTDIMNLNLNSSTGAITIGSVTKTPLYSHQTMYYREIKVGGTQKISGTASTALDFKNTHSVNYTYDGGLHSFVMSQTTPSGDNRVTGEIAFIIPSSSS